MYLDNCIDDINNCIYEENNINIVLNDLDYQFKQWEIIETQHKRYLEYVNNPERSIVLYQDYNTFNVLLICIYILQICLINFVIIPSEIVVIPKNKG